MRNTIHAGAILINDDALLPEGVHVETEPFARGWKLVKNFDGDKLNREIGRAGWTFFSFAGEITSTVFGSEGAATVRRALKRILVNADLGQSNSLEVTRVTPKHFLGVPYTTVYACSRHARESIFFFRRDEAQGRSRDESGRGLSGRRPSPRVEVVLEETASRSKLPLRLSIEGDSK
ncbi:MAG TPA: hypothetical protein VGR71_09295 [Nitrospira sp.]|nr:hypothetical protein [Nitrospira sp.]